MSAVPADGLSLGDFVSYLARSVGGPEARLDAERPLDEQLELDSMRMIELAVTLEQELGIDLDDDGDLRGATPAELYAGYRDA